MEYYSKLLLQYCNSRGYSIIDVDEKIKYDYINWLLEQEESRKIYKEFIESLGIEINSNDTIEINKGILDSIAEEKTLIISPYQNLKINGEDKMFDDLKYARDRISKTIITQNPYSIKDLEYIFGIDKFLIGVYGKMSDCDKDIKIRKLMDINQILLKHTEEQYETKDGSYLYTIQNKKAKEKNKSIGYNSIKKSK